MTFASLPLLVSLLAAQTPAPTPPKPAPAAATAPSAVPGIAPLPGRPNLLALGVPQVPAELTERVQQYQESRAAQLLDVSSDGKQVLVSTRFADVNQLHVVELPLGARTQLTFTKEPINKARFLPGDPRHVFYFQDKGGGEFFQLFRLDRLTGRSELLTDGRSRHEALVVSKDGRWLAYAGTGRNGKDTDVYVAPTAEPKQAKLVTQVPGSWAPLDFSRDGSKLLVRQYRAAGDSDLSVVDLKTNTRTQLTPKEGKGSVEEAVFTQDGQGVYLSTDRYSDFAEVYRLPLTGTPPATPQSLTKSVRWNVDHLELSADGRKLAVVSNEDGYGRLYLLDTRTQGLTPVETPRGVISQLRFPVGRSDQVAFSLSSARVPMDIFMVDLGTKKTTRWTRSETGGLSPETFVEPELVRYPSTDGVKVPALLYRPRDVKGKLPVVVVFHGGPESQSLPSFNPQVQLMAAELGMAVLVPNVRGSEGYGKAYRAMDDGVKREQSLADIGATLDFIATRPELDASRVGVYGGSYGGYMTLAAAAFFPERIKAAVDMVGISSLPSFLQNTQAYRRDLRRAEYGDERDPAVRKVQERISPLGSVGKIRAALFVQQGANDPRVPRSEAEQIVQAVRAKGSDVWYLLATDEGHGFQKKANRDLGQTTALMFFQKHLASPAAGPGSGAAGGT